jgi:hypothetical protein
VAILVSSDLYHITKKKEKREEEEENKKEKREDEEMTTQKLGYNTGPHIRTE